MSVRDAGWRDATSKEILEMSNQSGYSQPNSLDKVLDQLQKNAADMVNGRLGVDTTSPYGKLGGSHYDDNKG